MSQDVNTNKTLPRTFFPFVWHFLKNFKFAVVLFVALTLAAGLWGPFNNILIKRVIDLLPQTQPGDISPILLPAALIVINFIIFDNFTWRGIDYLNYRYEGIIKNHVIHTCYEHILGQSHQFFQDHLSGRLANQITTLANNIEIILHRTSADFLRGASLVLMSFVASYWVNPIFFYILLVWMIFFSTISIWMSRRLVHLADKHAENESLVSGQIVDGLSNQSNIRIFSQTRFEITRINQFLKNLLTAFQRKEGYLILLYSLQGGMIAIMVGFSVFFLVNLHQHGLVSVGDFALILGLSMNLGHMIWYTMFRVDEFNQAYGKCKQSLSALMLTQQVQDSPDAKPLACTSGEIIFDNVHFQYENTNTLFKDKTVTIKAGQKVGLVGYSGSGKSTFVNLILRLYDISGGAILIDGQDISSVTQESLRQKIGLIPQDPSLFHRTLMDNIRYGDPSASDADVMQAAKQAHAHEFITQLPEGYDSLVGERGIKLSGGQRQRIAIARAFLKDAPILILDEATSQLDSVTENLIQESLTKLMQNKTAIVIAHRLSTLLHMDRILVFDNGSIIEDGNHNELLAKNGLYKKLWDAQIGGFLGDNSHDPNVEL